MMRNLAKNRSDGERGPESGKREPASAVRLSSRDTDDERVKYSL
jgi:hypothetical protein